jgi:hypothetical protein
LRKNLSADTSGDTAVLNTNWEQWGVTLPLKMHIL